MALIGTSTVNEMIKLLQSVLDNGGGAIEANNKIREAILIGKAALEAKPKRPAPTPEATVEN